MSLDFDDLFGEPKKQKKKQRKGTSVSKKVLALAIIATLVCSVLGSYIFFASTASASTLKVEIIPHSIKLLVNQTETFTAIVYNGSAPFEYKWTYIIVYGESIQDEEKYLGDTKNVTFSFTTHCSHAILQVHVRDSQGNEGFASAVVFDPISQNIYLDDLPATASYVVKTDATGTYWAVRSDGRIEYSGKNASLISQNVLNQGGHIHFLEGTYTLDSKVTVKSNTFVSGQSWATIFVNDAVNYTITTLEIEDGAENITLTNFCIDINNKSAGGQAIYGKNLDNIVIDKLYIYDGDRHGIFLDADPGNKSTNIRIVNNKIEDVDGYCVQLRRVEGGAISHNIFLDDKSGSVGEYGGVNLWTDSEHVTVTTNSFQGCGEFGVYVYGRYHTISANTINSSYYGIRSVANYTSIANNIVTNTSIAIITYGYGASLGHCTSIVGNTVHLTQEEGIWCAGSSSWNITGIEIIGNTVTAVSLKSGNHGSIKTTYMYGDIIMGNYVENTDGYYGIYCSGGDYHVVVGNNYQNTGGVLINGANNEIAHNITP